MRLTFVTVSLLVALSLTACKGKPKTGAASLGAVPVCAPFSGWAPPTEGGTVWFCDAKSLQVIYDGGDKASLGTKYEAAITAHGWVRRNPIDSTPQQWMGLYDKDHKALTIVVGNADFSGKVPGGVQVTLGLADMPPAPPG